jgi:uncharacterized LabA/DUF88 family protein
MADPPQAGSIPRCRVRIFVDFWNYELAMKGNDADFLTDWRVIGEVLTQEAGKVVNYPGLVEYQGLNFYASYDPAKPNDDRFRKWATTIVDAMAGIHVSLVARQKKKSPPKCPACHEPIAKCPHCGADMRGTEEKGVDTRIVTDMMSLAWAMNYEVAVLVSSDKDFVPTIEFLQDRGLKVLHAAFPPQGAVLTQKCWGMINIPAIREKFRRTKQAR